MSQRGDIFQPVLAALAADSGTAFAAPGARVEALRRINGPYSSVLHVKIETPAGATRAYVKVLKPRMPGAEGLAQIDRMLEREFLATRGLYQALQQDAGIAAVRPMAWLPELKAIVTEEVPGRTFGDVLPEGTLSAAELEGIAGRVARWLRVYQSIERVDAPIAIAERRQYLDERLVLLEGRVLSSDQRRATLAQFDALAAEIGAPTVPAVRIHADLTPANIIVNEAGRIAVLDFTMAKSGTVYHDLAHLFFHFELHAARHRARSAAFRAFQRALLDGFQPGLTADDPLFRMMLLQHGVCHVALIAERRVPLVDAAYRWFLRRRWRLCSQMPLAAPALQPA